MSKHRVLIGYSRCWLTRQAFLAKGIQAFTCDLLPAREDDPSPDMHVQMDVWEALDRGVWDEDGHRGYDYGLFHPMCTYLTVSAAWAFKDPDFYRYPGVGYHQRLKAGTLTGAERRAQREVELENFRRLLALPFPAVMENPATSFINTAIRPPTQIIHPHQFGDDASKATGLWHNDAAIAAGLPLLQHTQHVAPRMINGLPRWANQTDSGQNRLSPGEQRWLERSATYPGIAAAIGGQWGNWLQEERSRG